MSLLIVVIIVVLFPPLYFSVVLFSKKYLMAFLAGHSGGNRSIWPSSFHLLSVISMDSAPSSIDFQAIPSITIALTFCNSLLLKTIAESMVCPTNFAWGGVQKIDQLYFFEQLLLHRKHLQYIRIVLNI